MRLLSINVRCLKTAVTLFLTTGYLISCTTKSPVQPESSPAPIEYDNLFTYKGISFSYIPLEPSFLEDLHGLDSRYFTESSGLFPPRLPCVISFKATVPDETALILKYGETYLMDEEGNRYYSQTRSGYYDLWKEKTPASLQSKLSWLIDHNLYKEVQSIAPGQERESYFVFLMNRPRRGDFTLNIPLKIDNEEGRLSLPLTLNIDRIETENRAEPEGPAFIPQIN